MKFGKWSTRAVAVVSFAAAPALGQEERETSAGPKTRFPVAIDAGLDATMSFGTAASRTGSDTVMYVDTHFLAGVHVAPAFYLTPRWSVGLRGALSSGGGGPLGDGWALHWQAEAEGRYHFIDGRKRDLWLGADVGVAAFSQRFQNDGLGPPATVTVTSPIFGLGAGAFFAIADSFLLGPELRGTFTPWGDLPGSVPRGTQLSDQAGVFLGVTGTVRLGG